MGDAEVLACGPASKRCRDDASADSWCGGPEGAAFQRRRLDEGALEKKTNILGDEKKEANPPP